MNQQLLNTALATWTRMQAQSPCASWWVPGRIEVLGKHTDYAGGRVLTCATGQGLVVVVAPRSDAQVRVHSGNEQVLAGVPSAASWAIYVEAAVTRLRANFPGPLQGADIAVASDLPPAAGMSSSSALLLGLSAALAAVWGLDQQPQWPTDFSGYAACIENGNDFAALRGHTGVGTQGGAMDHTAICGATAGALTSWKMSPVERECEVILPPEVTLMVAVSGVQAEKTGAARAAYNAVSQRAARALQAWNLMRQRHDLTLSAAVAAGAVPTDFTDADLGLRVEQFIQESNVIIPAATTALRHGDLALFGKIAADSQALSASHLRNQVPETIALADLAKRHGAHAASAFGAGFGGAVWALVDRRQLDAFSKTWLAAYQRSFPNRVAHMYPIEPGPAMARLP